MSWHAWNRRWGSSMVDMEIIKQYEVPLSTMTSETLHRPGIDRTHYLDAERDVVTEFVLFIRSRTVFKEHLQRMRHADRGRLIRWTPGSVSFGTCIFKMCWIVVSLNSSYLSFHVPLLTIKVLKIYEFPWFPRLINQVWNSKNNQKKFEE